MSNPFKRTPVYFFQVPQDMMKARIWETLSLPSRSVYVYLCFLAHMSSKGADKPIAVTDEQLARDNRISDRSIRDVRKELKAAKLIRYVKHRGSHHDYYLLEPVSGRTLEAIEDINDLPEELVEAYLRHRLTDHDLHRHKDSEFKAICPFHFENKLRLRPFSVKLTIHGKWLWACSKCRKKGNLCSFEREMARKSKDEMTHPDACRRVITVVNAVRHDQAMAQAAANEAARAMI